MTKNLLLILFLLFGAMSVQAGSYGFIYKGQVYYKYKNGKKLDQSPFTEKSRTPANSDDSESLFLYFVEDEYARCYYWGEPKSKVHKSFSKAQKEKNIHCFKINELKPAY